MKCVSAGVGLVVQTYEGTDTSVTVSAPAPVCVN